MAGSAGRIARVGRAGRVGSTAARADRIGMVSMAGMAWHSIAGRAGELAGLQGWQRWQGWWASRFGGRGRAVVRVFELSIWNTKHTGLRHVRRTEGLGSSFFLMSKRRISTRNVAKMST